jgi:hypothetical protein
VLNRIGLPDELGRGHHCVRAAVLHERQACAEVCETLRKQQIDDPATDMPSASR